MGAVLMGMSAQEVQSVEELLGKFLGEFNQSLPSWKDRFCNHPDQLEGIEREVHQLFSRGADYVVAGLLAFVLGKSEFLESAEQVRQGYSIPLRSGVQRTRKISLLGGLVIWISSLYCAARNGGRRGEETVAGVYTELVQLGIGSSESPALESLVARQAAIAPSLKIATDELARQGVKLDIKAVRRITQQAGERLLALRRDEVLLWREGKLPAGSELAGKRVCVQIDGGRTRIRSELTECSEKALEKDENGLVVEDTPGRSKKKAKRTFSAQWREPKLVRIFVHDEEGKMDADEPMTIDGTFEGPDALAELIAMHLHRLGAGQAHSITFVADGAPWIWDRIARIVELAKLQAVPVHEVLDNCHASHHIQLALTSLGLTDRERKPLYLEHRTLLRNGQWRRVIEELTEVAYGSSDQRPANEDFDREIAYLRKHGEAGRMKYVTFRSWGLPIGSGAIESCIRRVVNMRLKGSGTFWSPDNAEAMLQVRSLIISNRWDERLKTSRQRLRYNSDVEWRWDYRPMSSKIETDSPNQETLEIPTP